MSFNSFYILDCILFINRWSR